MLAGPIPPIIETPVTSPSWIGLAITAAFVLVFALVAFTAWFRFRGRTGERIETPELRKAA